jgi:hypothetical protein
MILMLSASFAAIVFDSQQAERERFRKFFCTVPTQAKIADFCLCISGI